MFQGAASMAKKKHFNVFVANKVSFLYYFQQYIPYHHPASAERLHKMDIWDVWYFSSFISNMTETLPRYATRSEGSGELRPVNLKA